MDSNGCCMIYFDLGNLGSFCGEETSGRQLDHDIHPTTTLVIWALAWADRVRCCPTKNQWSRVIPLSATIGLASSSRVRQSLGSQKWWSGSTTCNSKMQLSFIQDFMMLWPLLPRYFPRPNSNRKAFALDVTSPIQPGYDRVVLASEGFNWVKSMALESWKVEVPLENPNPPSLITHKSITH